MRDLVEQVTLNTKTGMFEIRIYNEEGEVVSEASVLRKESVESTIVNLKKEVENRNKRIIINEEKALSSDKKEMRNENGESVRVMDGLFKTDHEKTNRYESIASMFLQLFETARDEYSLEQMQAFCYGALNWAKQSIKANDARLEDLVSKTRKLSSAQEDYFSSLKYNETILTGVKASFKEIEETYNLSVVDWNGKFWDWDSTPSTVGESPAQRMFREEQEKRKALKKV